MIFWLTCFVIAAATCLYLYHRLMTGGTQSPLQPDESSDVLDQTDANMTFYKTQLAALEQDLQRDLLSQEDFVAAQKQLAQRLLAAERAQQNPVAQSALDTPTWGYKLTIIFIAALLPVSLGLYWHLGAPGYPDLPYQQRIQNAQHAKETRPSQAQAEAAAPTPQTPQVSPEIKTAVAQLRSIVAQRPNDLEGWTLLAAQEVKLNNFSAAAKAHAQIITIKGDKATVTDHTMHLILLVTAANNFVSPEAEEVIGHILQQDPKHIAATYYLGDLYQQTDRPDRAFKLWRDIITAPPQDDYRFYQDLARRQISTVAFRAGINYTPPDMPTTQSSNTPNGAARIPDGFSALESKLASEGGSASEWARLIIAYGEIGNTSKAQTLYAEARGIFAQNQSATQQLKDAASTAGIAP